MCKGVKIKISHSFRIYGKPRTLQKIITIEDMNTGFKLFIENPNIKNRNETKYCSLYI
jgi:hypothetical protein